VSNSYYGDSSRSLSRAAARALAAPQRENKWRRGISYLLPALLIGLTTLVMGAYYETTDDMLLTLLLRGVFSAQPVTDLHLELHGLSHLIAFAYQILPGLPWYGIFMFFCLYLALVLIFRLIFKLGRRIFTNEQVAFLVTFLFIGALADTLLSFHFSRVAMLLSAASFLTYAFDSKEPGGRHTRILLICSMGMVLALCISTGAAVLGLALALPAALRVPGRTGIDFRNLVTSLVPFALVGVLFFSFNILTRSDDEIAYQRQKQRIEAYEDYGLYYFRTVDRAADPRAYAVKGAIREGMLGDRVAINEPFFARAGGYEWGKFLTSRAPAKLAEASKRIAKDYFLLLAINVLIVVYSYSKLKSTTRRQLLIFTEVWILGILIVVAAFFKLPPRLASPGLTVLTLVNVTFFLRHRRFQKPSLPIWLWLGILLMLAGHIYRSGIRMQIMHDHQRENEQFLASVQQRFQGQLLITAGLEEYLAYLSPWEDYSFGSSKLLPLTGWYTLSPEYREYLHHLTGQTSFEKVIDALSRQPKAIWISPIGFEDRLNDLLKTVHGTQVQLVPFKPFVPAPGGDETTQYMVALPDGRTTPVGSIPGTLMQAPPVVIPTDSAAGPQ
jgi:hypothetical protein